MTIIAKFPDRSLKCRLAARLPRRSKNGTPDERAAKRAAAEGEVVSINRRAVIGATAAALAGGAAINLAALAIAKAETGSWSAPVSDPIFALIERHREAELRKLAAGAACAVVEPSDPNHGAARKPDQGAS
jgi:hypothetical protein